MIISWVRAYAVSWIGIILLKLTIAFFFDKFVRARLIGLHAIDAQICEVIRILFRLLRQIDWWAMASILIFPDIGWRIIQTAHEKCTTTIGNLLDWKCFWSVFFFTSASIHWDELLQAWFGYLATIRANFWRECALSLFGNFVVHRTLLLPFLLELVVLDLSALEILQTWHLRQVFNWFVESLLIAVNQFRLEGACRNLCGLLIIELLFGFSLLFLLHQHAFVVESLSDLHDCHLIFHIKLPLPQLSFTLLLPFYLECLAVQCHLVKTHVNWFSVIASITCDQIWDWIYNWCFLDSLAFRMVGR